MKITFVGGGNLTSALVGGLRASARTDLTIRVIDRNEGKRAALTTRYGVVTQALFDADAARTDVLVLAVKPHDIAALAHDLRDLLSDQVVVSVAAGIRTATLAGWLGGYTRVVWAMPNTAALVGRAVTGLYAAPCVTGAERSMVQTVFEAVGAPQWLADESMMDALTAICGCGPAYVYVLVESLEAAARGLGFDSETARSMAARTLFGASTLLERTGEGPARLREKITTPRGVTEQAVASMPSDMDAIIARAVARAQAKSQAIGMQNNGVPHSGVDGAAATVPLVPTSEGREVER